MGSVIFQFVLSVISIKYHLAAAKRNFSDLTWSEKKREYVVLRSHFLSWNIGDLQPLVFLIISFDKMSSENFYVVFCD